MACDGTAQLQRLTFKLNVSSYNYVHIIEPKAGLVKAKRATGEGDLIQGPRAS